MVSCQNLITFLFHSLLNFITFLFHHFKDILIEKSGDFVKNGADHQRTHLNALYALPCWRKHHGGDLTGWQCESFRYQVQSLQPNTLGDFNFLTYPMTISPVISTLWTVPRIVKILRGFKRRDIFCQPSSYAS